MSKLKCAPTKLVLRKIDTGNEKYLKTKSGIIVDKATVSVELIGEVVAVGKDIDWIKEGDMVYHGMHAGQLFNCSVLIDPTDSVPDETLMAIREDEVLGFVEAE